GRTRVPLNETPFVKALAGFADPEKMELSSFGDFIMSPFSGIPISKAQDLCAKWRGTKGVELVEILSDIVEVSESCHEIIMFFLNEKYDKMSRLMIANYTKHLSKELGLELHGHGESDLRRAVPIELKLAITASEKAVTMLDLGNHLGIPPAKCVELMSLEKVSCRYMIRGFGDHAADEASCVRFGTMGGLSSRKAGVVVLTGLASSTFPVSRDLDAGDEVLDSCGTPQLDDMLEQRRHAFYMAIQAAEKRLVVERRLNDADGNEERPSVLFEELSDCYRQDLSDFDSMDKTTSLPECLVDDGADVLRIMQEDDLGTITSVPSYIQPDDGEEGPLDCKLGYMDKSLPSDFPVGISPVDAESLSDDQRLDIAAMALGTPDNPKPLTPTGIELYMMCPYRWFVESKVRPQTLDVVLDTMALGTFTHALLMKYYYLLSDGLAKPRRITEDDVPHVAPMLQACRDSFLDEQAHLDPSGPFTKLTQLEKRQLDEKTRRVSELLVDDCSFLGEFVPSFLEQKFGGDNGEFVYGGHPFVGIIDRMDLRRDGKVVVIDYKGGLNSFDFPVHGSEMTTPEHMQVLIYAAVAQRVFGYEVVGALYRSYSRRQEVRGAFDMSHIGPENIFGNDKGGLSANEMSELMEVVEDDVRSAIQRMHVGDIVPNPKSGKTCKYCIVPDCPRRLS
ncbi:MAG: PD-(D/E)XK nuclease family protein, partial [Coriobacteriales bacterium]